MPDQGFGTSVHFLTKDMHTTDLYIFLHCLQLSYMLYDRKRYARANCNYSFKKLRRIVSAALDTVTLDHICKHFRECWDYHHAYMDGKTAVDVVAEVKT